MNQPTSQLCREREAYHLQMAQEATLANVRLRALGAAAVWHTQAVEAEVREAGGHDELSAADAEIAAEFLLEETMPDFLDNNGE
jgi:hypothetical protein